MSPAFSQSAAMLAPAAQPSTPAAPHIVTVPAGTAIPLTLINPIRSKTSKPGDAVRATVAFPVTAGAEVAIPAGSYVEGTLEQVTARARGMDQPQVKIHFTRVLFASGYSVPLDAENTQAELEFPDTSAPVSQAEAAAAPAIEYSGGAAAQELSAPAGDEQFGPATQPRATGHPHLVLASYGIGGQQQPTLPSVGPSPAVVIGVTMGGVAAFAVAMMLRARHRASNLDYVLFDSGWQFQMVLLEPLTIDVSKAAAATVAPAGD